MVHVLFFHVKIQYSTDPSKQTPPKGAGSFPARYLEVLPLLLAVAVGIVVRAGATLFQVRLFDAA